MTIVGCSDINDLPRKIKTPRATGLDGYGKRSHPTRWMVKLPGSNRWRRVYSCCSSNAGTCYVAIPSGTKKPNWHVIEGNTPKTERLE